jgi:hypothetical protein
MKRAEFLALPSGLSLPPIQVPRAGSQRIPATGTLGPGQVVIDVPSIRLSSYGRLTLAGDATTTQVIVRVTGTRSITVGYAAHIALAGLQPEQVLVLASGPIILCSHATVSGNLLATRLITVRRSGKVDGTLLSGTGFRLNSYASVMLHPFVAW